MARCVTQAQEGEGLARIIAAAAARDAFENVQFRFQSGAAPGSVHHGSVSENQEVLSGLRSTRC